MPKTFGEHLRKERVKKSLTAEAVAKASGISRSYITLIERGKRRPGKSKISKIADALNVKTGVVLNWYLEDLSQRLRRDL